MGETRKNVVLPLIMHLLSKKRSQLDVLDDIFFNDTVVENKVKRRAKTPPKNKMKPKKRAGT